MDNAGILTQKSSPWKARTNFPLKKKGSKELKVVHNFIPINKYTIKLSYQIYRLEEILNIIIKPGYDVYFIADVSNGYWAVPIKVSDCNITGFMTLNGLLVFLCIGPGLKKAAHTYYQFSVLVFGLPPTTCNKKILW